VSVRLLFNARVSKSANAQSVRLGASQLVEQFAERVAGDDGLAGW
jgi:hypothetical protein